MMPSEALRELSKDTLEPFLPLLAEIECGDHFSPQDPAHEAWLGQIIHAHLASGVRFFGRHGPEGQALGVVGVRVDAKLFCEGSAEITDIGVVVDHRRSGLGAELLRFAVEVARRAAVHAVFARTYAADTGVIAFYGRSQFYPVAVIPGTNGPDDEGTIVMRRRL